MLSKFWLFTLDSNYFFIFNLSNMKFTEIKDLEAGDNIVITYIDITDNYWDPYIVTVKKDGPEITLIDPDLKHISFSIGNCYHLIKGKDINDHVMIDLAVFDNITEAYNWCKENNEFNKKYNL